MSKRWLLVSTYSGAEWVAFCTLPDRGIPALFPRLIRSARRGRWLQASFAAQFPGYVFAALDDGASIESIKRVIGVREIVRNGHDVVTISPNEIAVFRNRWLKEFRRHAPRRKIIVPIRFGDAIQIPAGAFAGTPALITSIDKSGFATASLGALQASFHVSALQQSGRISAPSRELQSAELLLRLAGTPQGPPCLTTASCHGLRRFSSRASGVGMAGLPHSVAGEGTPVGAREARPTSWRRMDAR